MLCHGKGRKDRNHTADRHTVQILTAFTIERPSDAQPIRVPHPHRNPDQPRRGRGALTQHTATAATFCPTLNAKTVTPHVLRHTAAMRLLPAGVDSTVIALWLGHESVDTTQVYLHADMTLKENA